MHHHYSNSVQTSNTFLHYKQRMFYPLNHHLLDGFFDILDFLPLVAINQHDLTQEERFHSY